MPTSALGEERTILSGSNRTAAINGERPNRFSDGNSGATVAGLETHEISTSAERRVIPGRWEETQWYSKSLNAKEKVSGGEQENRTRNTLAFPSLGNVGAFSAHLRTRDATTEMLSIALAGSAGDDLRLYLGGHYC